MKDCLITEDNIRVSCFHWKQVLADITCMKRNLLALRETPDKENGFTLIELMIVVVIIGILAAVAIPVFANQQKAAVEATVKSDIKTINGEVALFLTKNPAAPDISKHSDFANTSARPHIYVTSGNVANISGSWEVYRIVVRDPERNFGCNFHSSTGKTTCSYTITE